MTMNRTPQALRPHPFLPTMGSGAAYGPCQTRWCALPYADAIHHGGAPTPLVHAFSLDIQAAARAAACSDIGAVRGPADAVTCPDCREILALRAQTIEQSEADIAGLLPAPGLGDVPQDRSADGVPEVEQVLAVDDLVQRRGEVGPDCPVGVIKALAPGGGFRVGLVSFSGMSPLRMRLDGLVKVAQADRPIITEKRFADMTHGELRTLVRRLGQPVGDATWNQLATIAERAEVQGLVVQPAEVEQAGTSDRVAAALNELAALRILLGRTRMGGDRRDDLTDVLDRAVGLLRAEGGSDA